MTYQIPLDNDLIVDNFAGGGGASTGIEMALGRPVNIAINHDPEALGMQAANHPLTRHYCENVFAVDPVQICAGRRVALAWFSPDCTHHRKAKGGKPRLKHIRGLAWVVIRWARTVRPRIICLENVEEFQDWGPLTPEGYSCAARKGQTFNFWVEKLKRYGYRVEWRELRACDYGAPTIRKRLFLIARCDGLPIVWPEPTHGDPKKIRQGDGLKPWRTAVECIAWSIPCPSLFDRKKPLAENTMRRMAKGIQKFVIEAEEPFIVSVNHGDSDGRREYPMSDRLMTVTQRNGYALVAPSLIQMGYGEAEDQAPRVLDLEKPLGTVTAGGNKFALSSAFLVGAGGPAYSGKPVPVQQPFGTLLTENHKQLVTAFLAQYSTERRDFNPDRSAEMPLSTILTRGTQAQLVTSHIMKMYGTTTGSPAEEPLHTVPAGGLKHTEVRAFLLKYYGTDQDPRLDEPLHSITTKDRFGLVTIHGERYAIVDIGMRMLTPAELYRAQGFREGYIIDRGAAGKPITRTAQVRMCGNSVCPPMAAAIMGFKASRQENLR
jgi:DNA (cytosine-5)-methyltransferase 1